MTCAPISRRCRAPVLHRTPARLLLCPPVPLLLCVFPSLLAAAPEGAAPAAPSPPAAEQTRPLAAFPQDPTDLQKWMRDNGWESKRQDPKRFEVGKGCLHMVSEKDSVMIGTERGFPVKVSDWPRLRVRLRIAKLPAGADLAKKSGDDAAFRVYVAFDRGGGLFSPPNTLAYAWTEKTDPDTLIPSPHFSSLKYMAVGKGAPAPKDDGADWITLERDLEADYRRAFPEDKGDVPDLKGIILKCDSNDTGTSAEAWVKTVELVK